MVDKKYVNAYRDFVRMELELASVYSGKEYARRMTPFYERMLDHIEKNFQDYVVFDDSKVSWFEREVAEEVDPIRELVLSNAAKQGFPVEAIFIPRVKLEEKKWDRIVHVRVAEMIRSVYDEAPGADFEMLRNYRSFHNRTPIVKWIWSVEGMDVVTQIQRKNRCKIKFLIRNVLNLFDNEFVRQQLLWLSQETWIHHSVISAYEIHGKPEKPVKK